VSLDIPLLTKQRQQQLNPTSTIMLSAFYSIDASVLASILAATIGALATWNQVIRPRLTRKKPFDALPMPEGSHPLLGHILHIAGSADPAMSSLLSNTDPITGRLGVWIGRDKAVAVTSWQDARAILNAESYKDQPRLYKKHIGKIVGEKSILLLNGREWKIHRAAIKQAFTPVALKSYRDAMHQVTQTLVASIHKRVERDGNFQCEMEPLMKMLTLDVFGLVAFSHDFGCCRELETSALADAFDFLGSDADFRMKNQPIKPSHYFYSLPSDRNRNRHASEELVRAFVRQCLKDREAMQQKPSDLLTFLMEAGQEDSTEGGEIGKDVLNDILLTTLFAGYDTTSVALSYALHVIGTNPDVKLKCQNEIQEVGSIDKVEELGYCKAVIQESLRFYPPVATVTRRLKKTVTLPHETFTIPPGTTAVIPVWAIHHDERNFSRPNDFLPERWTQRDDTNPGRWVSRAHDDKTNDHEVPPGNPRAFFAFSGGARGCPGQRFAFDEATVALAGLVQAFEIRPVPDYTLQPQRKVAIQHPHDQLPMILTSRTASSNNES
jgi:cytochrome P450